MLNYQISAKKKFGILTKLMKNQKYSSISSLIDNGTTTDDPLQKAELLNKTFSSKSTVKNSDDDVPHLEKKEHIPSFDMINTSPFEIAKIIRGLKQSYLSHCGIPGKFISLISTPISFSLSKLFNNLFCEGFFPDIWKLSHVTALFKQKGLKSDKNNYRPISLLPTLSKICESVMHKRLLDHCIENNVISSKQAAYLKGDSTVNQLLYIVDKIKKSWTKGDLTHGIFLDVKSAFDKVWHKGLIAKLNQININGKLLDLFSSYLYNRQQIVVVDGKKSERQQVKAGIPQGSRLGPLLFIIYINDITDSIESDILIFADDTSLLVSGKTTDDTARILNRDLGRINEWSVKWKVTFNADKSEEIIFFKSNLKSNIPLVLNGEQVKRVDTHKHLGLYLTYNLDWSIQVHNVCLKANKKLAVLRSVKYLKRNTLDLLYKITVRSCIDYALPVYYHCLRVSEKAKLDKIQYTAGTIVSGALHLTSKEKLNNELSWESIKTRADFLGLTLFHKIATSKTRPLVRSCLPKQKVNPDSLRSGNLMQFPYLGEKYAKSFFPFFTKQYNSQSSKTRRLIPEEFSAFIAKNMKPNKYKHFSYGHSKHANMLLARIRIGYSYLKAHSYTTGHTDTMCCTYCDNNTPETSKHFMIICPHLYLILKDSQNKDSMTS